MTDHITDSETVTITVVAHGNLDVAITNAPTQVFVNEPFDIDYDVTNNGGDDMCYGHAKIGGTVQSGTRWDEAIVAGATVSKTATVTIISIGSNDVVIEVGYTT